MSRTAALSVMALALAIASDHFAAADDKHAQNAARNVLAKFDHGDPGWKVRMGSLVELAKQGPGAVPVLLESLKTGSPSAREYAAQALVYFAEPSMRPSLEQALDDKEPGVRFFAIQALSMLGRLERTEKHERIMMSDPNHWGVRPLMAAALERNDRPDSAKLRKRLAAYDLRDVDKARLGQLAPDFTLTDFNGKPQRLSDFRGKKTVVVRFILFDF